jgi:D-glycero-alpha-D-manno-heptose-7-phosphate kinase
VSPTAGRSITWRPSPARSGSYRARPCTVGLLNTLYALQRRIPTKAALTAEATPIEQEVIGESVGCQDQLWAACGGLNRIDFTRDRGISVKQLILSAARRRELVACRCSVLPAVSHDCNVARCSPVSVISAALIPDTSANFCN